MRPLDFLIIGAQKSGTTSLRRYLAKNLDVIRMSQAGELHFFDDESVDWNHPDYEAYHQKFASLNTRFQDIHKLGESTPIYLYWRPCVARIHAYNPRIKLILVLRNPMDRAFSHWNMEWRRQRDPLSFSEALSQETERAANVYPLQDRNYSYLDRGRYVEQVTRVYSFFAPEQVLILKAEELFQSPASSLERIEAFLNCRLANREPERMRAGIYSSSLGATDWQWMYSRIADDIHQLEHLLGWDCRDWHTPPAGP